MPVSQDYFAGAIGEFDRQAATLRRIAELGRQQAKRTLKSGEAGDGVRETLKDARKKAIAINARFEDFARPLVFSDHQAHQVVAATKTTLHKAVHEVTNAIRLIDASYRHAHDEARGAGRDGIV